MNITILTQYYPPETGAPQNRLHSLARHLVAAGHAVQVLTAMPNYPVMRVFDGYRGRLFARESLDGVDVRRSWIYSSGSKSFMPRMLNYFSFVGSSMAGGAASQRADYILCESPPLFLGMSALALARLKRARLVFNVSDLWPETAERLGIVRDGAMLRLAYRLEAALYRSSYLVTGQTQGIVRDIARRFPEVRTFWLPNGIDREAFEGIVPDPSWRARHGVGDRKVFMYAGILGHAQALDVVVRAAAALRDRPDIAIVIVGDGPVRDELHRLDRELGAGVIFVPNSPRPAVLAMAADAHGFIVPLRRLDLFLGAIPSKIFDPLGLGVPILLGVEGEARELFIERGAAGLPFEPESVEGLVAGILRLADDDDLRARLGASGLAFVQRHFDRRAIAQGFMEQLQA